MSSPSVAETIMQVLEQEHALTAPALVAALHQQQLVVNKTSVYRALETLISKGKVFRHALGGQQVVYELRAHHHDHLICTYCGRVQNVACLVHPPQTVEGFKVAFHDLTLYGVCAACQKILES